MRVTVHVLVGDSEVNPEGHTGICRTPRESQDADAFKVAQLLLVNRPRFGAASF